VYLLKTKDEALNYFMAYKAEAKNQLERKIKRLRSDRGGEYFSNTFDEFCVEYGIVHERTRLIHLNPMGLPRGKTAL
jgi:transposase InsO family protein